MENSPLFTISRKIQKTPRPSIWAWVRQSSLGSITNLNWILYALAIVMFLGFIVTAFIAKHGQVVHKSDIPLNMQAQIPASILKRLPQ